ncbi:MAG TPA: tRNA (adenosine(37)-N6)-threonylcarbamoyltransferase complex dimerization subunit type 1 TsaB [Candidatus Eisenbacteria bacterium]|nr:tRNA (adenosine(37)-N6)-threonylcarbamoyltransferase complex dimerization subunit type 1 TsaB [Candidatus Eisenbacteria bacterium]
MPCILGIDTSAPEGSVALARDGRGGAIEMLSPGGHSSGLSAAVGRLLEAAGIGLDAVGAFAVNEGPGSFTGLRIGLAWAKGAALGSSRPLVLGRAHDAMALAHAADAERLVTAIPGARGLVEAALWERGAVAWGPDTIEEGDLIPRLLERGTGGLAIVPATAKLARSLAEEAAEEEIAILGSRPLAPAVAAIGAHLLEQGQGADLILASPAYGREPNARKPGS